VKRADLRLQNNGALIKIQVQPTGATMDMEQGHAAHPRNNAIASSTQRASKSSRKLLIIVAAIVAVGLILSVSLGLGLSNKSNPSPTGISSNAKEETATNPKTSVDTAKTDNTHSGSTTNSNEGVTFVNSLAAISPQTMTETYGSCEALQGDLKAAARMMGKAYIEQSIKWYYFDEGDFFTSSPVSTFSATTTRSSTSASATSGPSTGQTKAGVKTKPWGTNNRHDGVEEADFTQSNGVDVFVVYGSEVVVIAAATNTIKSRTSISSQPSTSVPDASGNCYTDLIQGMLLVDTNLVVFAQEYCYTYDDLDGDINMGGNSSAAYDDDFDLYYSSSSSNYSTKVLIYDTSDMSLRTTESLPGTYISSRAVGSNVYVVSSSSLDTYALTQKLDPYYIQSLTTATLDEDSYRIKALAQLELELDPYVELLSKTLDCTGLQKLTVFQNSNGTIASMGYNSMATISSFAVSAAPFVKNSTSMLLPNSYWGVYASNTTLVLTCQGASQNGMGWTPETYIITFPLEGTAVKPAKLGKVSGNVLGATAVDHVKKNGKNYIRVASTTPAGMGDFDEMGSFQSSEVSATSQVTVLEVTEGSDGMMPIVGELSGLGKPGDMIYSVLFQGDRAFVVTFNYTDPFYTIDMSDPTNPIKVGELEVPGFSTQLQAVGENLILGVGRSTDADDMPVNFQLSLFDAADFSKPRRVQQYEDKAKNKNITSYVESSAEYDTKAFRYIADTKTLIVPMTLYQYKKEPCEYDSFGNVIYAEDSGTMTSSTIIASSETEGSGTESTMVPTMISTECWYETQMGDSFDGFRVYKIDETNGITVDFSIEHAKGDFVNGGCYGYGYVTPRSLVFDSDVMTMKGHTVLSHDLTTKAETATPLDLDGDSTDCSGQYFH
jgi:Beta propeller domain